MKNRDKYIDIIENSSILIIKSRYFDIGGENMYRNLEAEMARAGITQREMSEKLGITATTLSFKLNGKSNLSLGECVEIKKILGTNEPIDYLFAEDRG